MNTPGLGRIKQVAMTVGDMARAVAFYRDTLGIRLLFEAPPHFAFFDCDGVRLMLAPAEGDLRRQDRCSTLTWRISSLPMPA